MKIQIKSYNTNYQTGLEVFIVRDTTLQPNLKIDIKGWKIPKYIRLADRNFNCMGCNGL